jgi:membrane protease subunit HflC
MIQQLKNNLLYLLAIVVLVTVMFLQFFMFTIDEAQRGLLIRLGNYISDPDNSSKPYIYKPGLHFKLPGVDQVVYLTNKLQTLEIKKNSEIMTKEQKFLLVDMFVKWRISDFSLFYERNGGSMMSAESKLENLIYDRVVKSFGTLSIKELVYEQRATLMQRLMESSKEDASTLGMEVVDVRFKKIELPTAIKESVHQRMSSSRLETADKLRSEGKSEAEQIKADAEREKRVMLAEAGKVAQELKGSGEAEAAAISLKAYSKDLDFFKFTRSMDAYKKSINSDGKDFLIIDPSSGFYKNLFERNK